MGCTSISTAASRWQIEKVCYWGVQGIGLPIVPPPGVTTFLLSPYYFALHAIVTLGPAAPHPGLPRIFHHLTTLLLSQDLFSRASNTPPSPTHHLHLQISDQRTILQRLIKHSQLSSTHFFTTLFNLPTSLLAYDFTSSHSPTGSLFNWASRLGIFPSTTAYQSRNHVDGSPKRSLVERRGCVLDGTCQHPWPPQLGTNCPDPRIQDTQAMPRALSPKPEAES